MVLTIDENIQFIAEKELAAAIEQTHAKAGTVIVQDPSNGEILAMASWPTFNPNAPADSSPAEARMNRAIGALYEPGSVFKIVTLSAAIDQGITTPDEVVDCQMGAIYIAGHRIRDHNAYGLLTVAQILAHSSDVGAIKIGLRLGAPKFYRLHSRLRLRRSRPESICREKTAACCGGSKTGRRFRWARSPWARKWA